MQGRKTQENIPKVLRAKLKNVSILALDVDGILTDGYVYVDQNEKETVRCSRRDGLGIELLKKAGMFVCVISKEANPVVTARCKKLDIRCFQKVETGGGKLEILTRVLKEQNMALEETAFMGDDVNDLPALEAAGVALTVADAHPTALALADYVTKAKSGEHAIRDVADRLLEARGIDPAELLL